MKVLLSKNMAKAIIDMAEHGYSRGFILEDVSYTSWRNLMRLIAKIYPDIFPNYLKEYYTIKKA